MHLHILVSLVIRNDRQDNMRGGGTAIYVKVGLRVREILRISDPNYFESLFVEVKCGNKDVLVGVVYSQHGNLDGLESTLGDLCSRYGSSVILGKQYVGLKGIKFTVKEYASVLPQCSILSPWLFLLYVVPFSLSNSSSSPHLSPKLLCSTVFISAHNYTWQLISITSLAFPKIHKRFFLFLSKNITNYDFESLRHVFIHLELPPLGEIACKKGNLYLLRKETYNVIALRSLGSDH
ncbi:hypothetical protein FF38_14053 [Lucilia cuprina]|uniref:Uncharacterized protein n=1 Tax=Lucilia cuprina TaxID=7375 RepID=A0A0L0BWI1_LUCCU|nr:hypothetical protein FF38_14053 [Lucilia cuprina]